MLILVGFRTIKPGDLASVWKTGPVLILHVVRQSNRVTIKRPVPARTGT